MAKEYKIQKKKTPLQTLGQYIFRGLVVVAVLIFAYIIYDKMNFSANSLDFDNVKKSKTDNSSPSELNWFNDFKGVENVPTKKQLEDENEKSGNFLGFGSN
eukprot:gnl/Chilomastix_cuspidata/7855.p1 GENE.gnl/Chilomastix_cuspidata/7855~~gnl/Chilomastix_cuspidata/7855.p1  ORF type:complete len:101 (+),score=11.55 gnl/Chilomastix_cuspidata/7855:32-334(+)